MFGYKTVRVLVDRNVLLACIVLAAVAAVATWAWLNAHPESASASGATMSMRVYADKAKTQLVCDIGALNRPCVLEAGEGFSVDIVATSPPTQYDAYKVVLDFAGIFSLQQQPGLAEHQVGPCFPGSEDKSTPGRYVSSCKLDGPTNHSGVLMNVEFVCQQTGTGQIGLIGGVGTGVSLYINPGIVNTFVYLKSTVKNGVTLADSVSITCQAPTNTATPSPTPSPTPTATSTATSSPTQTPTSTPPGPTNTPTPTQTPTEPEKKTALFLLIDEDGIDGDMKSLIQGLPSIQDISLNAPFCGGGLPAVCINDDPLDGLGDKPGRRLPPLFTQVIDITPFEGLLLPTGQVEDEGFFALVRKDPQVSFQFEEPKRSANSFTTQDLIQNLGNAAINDNLDKIADVMPLREEHIKGLLGHNVCALVYDSDISINVAPLHGNLKGATLGLTAFTVTQVLQVPPAHTSHSTSSSTLPDIVVDLLPSSEVKELCGNVVPWNTLTDAPVDADSDGCLDTQELGSNPQAGGQRSPVNFWDVFDTDTENGAGAGTHLQGAIDLSDIFNVAGRFGQSGDPGIDPLSDASGAGYHTRYDRGEQAGDQAWNRAPADGAVGISDVFAVAAQFAHSCL